MGTDQHLSRIEQENGIVFGLKWSLVGFALALCFLAGCSSFFDSGPERYNTVQGPRRSPLLNPGGAAQEPGQQPGVQPMPEGASQVPAADDQSAVPLPEGQSHASVGASADHSAELLDPFMQQPSAADEAAEGSQPQETAEYEQMSAAYDAAYEPQAGAEQRVEAAQTTQPEAMASAMPAQQDNQQAQAPVPQEQNTADTTPALQPLEQLSGDRRPPVSNVDAEITQLQQEFDQSQQQRDQLAKEQQDDSWLPNVGMDEWMGSEGQAAAAPQEETAPQAVMGAQPQQEAQTPSQDFKVVSIPARTPAEQAAQIVHPDTQAASAPAAPAQQPVAAYQVVQPQPAATEAVPAAQASAGQQPAPVAPIINAPVEDRYAHLPVKQEQQASVEVPVAPQVQNIPPSVTVTGLVPPAPYGAQNSAYLQGSRYAVRRTHQQRPQTN